MVRNAINRVFAPHRLQLQLQLSNKKPFTLTTLQFVTSVVKSFLIQLNDNDTRSLFQPVRILCAYRRDKNVQDTLIHSSLNATTEEDRGTFSCQRPRCKTCSHEHSTHQHQEVVSPSSTGSPAPQKTLCIPSPAECAIRSTSVKLSSC